MAPRSHGLSLLPIECRQAILVYLDDIASLRSAIVSHSSLYRAFCGAKSLILHSVLSNIVSPDLLPEACAILHASKIRRWYPEARAENLENFRQRRVQTKLSWQDATSIEEFHLSAKFFTADFISTALSKNSLKDEEMITNVTMVTAIEWHRVLRSFYWWEWYTLSCGRIWKLGIRKHLSAKHLEMFSIWEQEQLASVGEYLFHKIAKPFNEVAAHDIQWGTLEVDYKASEVWEARWPHRIKGFWVQRLPFLQRLISAETYDQRHDLMKSNWEMTSHSNSLTQSVLDAWHFTTSDELDPTLLRDYSEEKYNEKIGTPWAPDSDNGPVEAWRWTHQELPYEHFVQSPKLQWLRRRGYVMWNYERLSSWGFFDLEWNQFSGDMIRLSSEEIEERNYEMERSWQKRKEHYEQGEIGQLKMGSCYMSGPIH
ncbi:hypothetical protein N7493_000933 [Penicillium malachiteum]|uniref:Uncharacterized protein n=1 Tax=Penicillium malachiteum TaxID=1324776 RepID=A0AAD6HX92_9EURO|nr:hypothetical protein N7493_000933 [Penicillium malachiteum]